MRIAMVSEHASPLAALGSADAGGQNVHVEALARALGARGHAVTVYTRRTAEDQPDTVPFAPGAAVRHVPAGPPEEIAKDGLLPYMGEFGDWLAAEFAAHPPDVIHAHFWMSGLAALRAVRDARLPLVQAFHALGHVKRRHQRASDTSPKERTAAERYIGRVASAVIATASEEVEELRLLGVPRERTTVIPCGVDLDTFTPAGPRAERGDRPRIMTLGRIVERKGVDTVIRALARVPRAELLVVGGPDSEALDTDPDIRRMRGTAEASGVAERVRFHGRAPREEVPALLRSTDVLVSVPWYEPFGIVPLEAMACGVPVIASHVGGHRDTVVAGATGTLVPPRHPRLLAAHLRELLNDPVRREAYALSAADRALACYSWQRVARRTEEVYREVTGEGRGTSSPLTGETIATTGGAE